MGQQRQTPCQGWGQGRSLGPGPDGRALAGRATLRARQGLGQGQGTQHRAPRRGRAARRALGRAVSGCACASRCARGSAAAARLLQPQNPTGRSAPPRSGRRATRRPTATAAARTLATCCRSAAREQGFLGEGASRRQVCCGSAAGVPVLLKGTSVMIYVYICVSNISASDQPPMSREYS